MKKIVITGGHLTPALAVIEELEKKKNFQIYFFGRQYASVAEKTESMEAELLEEKAITFIPIIAGKVQRHWDRYTFLSYLCFCYHYLLPPTLWCPYPKNKAS